MVFTTGVSVVELVSDAAVVWSFELVVVASFLEVEVVEVASLLEVVVVAATFEVVEVVGASLVVVFSSEVVEVEAADEVVGVSEVVVASAAELDESVRPPSRSVAAALWAATTVRSRAWTMNESLARCMVENEGHLKK